MEWCEAALKQRSATGAYCLGGIYRKGLGTPKDPDKALTLLRQAADSGVVLAMREAADVLASGEAGTVERQQALIYLMRAILKRRQGDRAEGGGGSCADERSGTEKDGGKMKRGLFVDSAKLDAVFQSVQAIPLSK
jgi:TPR repeat protein